MKTTYYNELEQGTEEWLMARLGKVTASEVNNLVTPLGKAVSGAKINGYACDIASQRINMVIEDSYQSFDMQRGSFLESYAREYYNDNFDDVHECGFIVGEFDGIIFGASPDGLVGDDGIIEIKSRLAKFQVATIKADAVPKDYINQIQTLLLITGRKWVDYIQFCPGMSLFVKRVYADAERQKIILDSIAKFETLVEEVQNVYSEASTGMIRTARVEFIVDDVITESEGE